jgi:hypothetical protein
MAITIEVMDGFRCPIRLQINGMQFGFTVTEAREICFLLSMAVDSCIESKPKRGSENED